MNKLQIRKQVSALLNRNDATDDVLDSFIDQAIGRIQRNLRVPAMERAYVVTTNDIKPELIALPSDFLQLKHIFVGNNIINYCDVSKFIQTPDIPGAVPKIYTRIQGSYLLKPIPPAGLEITMIYYGEIEDLVEDTDSNFLSVVAPDLLVYAALAFAADYYLDDRKEMFESVGQRAYDELESQANAMEFAQEGLSVSTSFDSPEY